MPRWWALIRMGIGNGLGLIFWGHPVCLSTLCVCALTLLPLAQNRIWRHSRSCLSCHGGT